ncbi:MAG: hypothetical protein K8S97_06265, partial [Anaerolineae bacterium]|nr:hypothetical protein [Anaerolineae bacterium]
WLSRVVAAGALVVPIIVLIVSRTATRSGQPMAINVYWTNGITSIALGVLLLIALANLLRRLPDDVRNEVLPDLSVDDSDDVAIITMGVLVMVAALLLPVWMWTLLGLLTLGGVVAATYVAERIT